MIWQAWVVLVLLGSGAGYLALIRKDAAPFTSLVMVGAFTVAGFGAFDLETQYTTSTETGAAILLFMTALVGVITFMAAVTGQLDDEITDSPGGTALRDEVRR